jgi:hypothetical protein
MILAGIATLFDSSRPLAPARCGNGPGQSRPTEIARPASDIVQIGFEMESAQAEPEPHVARLASREVGFPEIGDRPGQQ